MNGKKAKQLRKIVNHVFLEKDKKFPYREYDKQTYHTVDNGRTNPTTGKHESNFVDITNTIKLISDCLRKHYKHMKQNYFEVNKYGRILNEV